MCLFSKCCRYRGLPVIWTDKIPASKRFKLLLDGEAVLDKETGLVWERKPDEGTYNWNSAVVYCRHKAIGGRMGWRLPAVDELASLIDADQSLPVLPPNGHPFDFGSGMPTYWAATLAPYNLRSFGGQPSLPGATGVAYSVIQGSSGQLLDSENVATELRAWCVRGGFNSSI